ncbi:uncharacterized protein LOC112191031 isoform X3 [Rosa chinensis]|uniref:uncharacterized protein LOC112191031 isoform X3 n=1 Tax=Rosa chinensis TaxID=74649 RepID=UPI001AD914CD|nr:uncharacterized protein LOC112191031 isoform X3 [Rosa chinensis]
MVEAIAVCRILDRGMPSGPEKLKVKLKKKQQDRHCHYAKALFNLPKKDDQMKPLTLHHRITTVALLCEPSKASFDQYLEDEQRVIKALFPGIEARKLNKKAWRIQMPTMQLLFMSVCLVLYISLRYKSKGKDYPPHVPHHIPMVLELEATRWELEGFPYEYRPRDFSISAKGTLYPDRKQGTQSKLRTQIDVILSFIVSPLLGWVPQSVMHSLIKSLVKTVMADSTSNARLLEDYDVFKTKNVVQYSVKDPWNDQLLIRCIEIYKNKLRNEWDCEKERE